MSRFSGGLAVLLVALVASACSPNEANTNNSEFPPIDPPIGSSDFVSADGRAGDQSRGPNNEGNNSNNSNNTNAPSPGQDGVTDDREVEEGDIYRLLGEGKILNLNSYRGLQVIDFEDLANPRILGRAEMSGWPVELYASGTRAVVLLNDWRGYYGSRFDSAITGVSGGLVVSVDLSDPAHPKITDQAHVPGFIQTSRLVRGSNSQTLYVAASQWGSWEGGDWATRTTVKSFDLSGDTIKARTELSLGGYVTDIQATPTRLLVAHGNSNWWGSGQGSKVSIVDISSLDGTMYSGAEVEVKGQVFSQFNMDMHKDVLRVVSGSRWGSTNSNYIQTFDAKDINDVKLIDQASFGDGENLHATLFRGNKAFFVTYFQVDPFHAFEITDAGQVTEKSEFIVS
ncbi:MAG: beta-propeller domain-containing protein, partial [Bradymonadaceae bacterium]|nr:beta-propeller domain-containing protein [Lujinxingiaceae bacterium]